LGEITFPAFQPVITGEYPLLDADSKRNAVRPIAEKFSVTAEFKTGDIPFLMFLLVKTPPAAFRTPPTVCPCKKTNF
jgi:hypothetical protein